MPKFKILITGQERTQLLEFINGRDMQSLGFEKSFESRTKAQEAYHDMVAILENEVNVAKLKLHAVVEHGHIVEVE